MRWGTNSSQTKQADEEKTRKINHRPKHPPSHPTCTLPAALASVNCVPPRSWPFAWGHQWPGRPDLSLLAPGTAQPFASRAGERVAGRRGLCVEVPREALSGRKSWESPPLSFQSKSMAHPPGDISTCVLSLVNVVIRLEYFFKR